MKRNLTIATSLFAGASIFPCAMLYFNCPQKLGLTLMFLLLLSGAVTLGVEIANQRRTIRDLHRVMKQNNLEWHEGPKKPVSISSWTGTDL